MTRPSHAKKCGGGDSRLIMGIDPGLATTGIGFIRIRNGRPVEAQWDCIRTKAGVPFPARLDTLYEEARRTIRRYKPDIISMERLFFSRNVRTAMTVGHAIGVLVLSAAKEGVGVVEYNPMQVKQAVTGSGGGDKRAVATMVTRILGLDEMPKPDDAADALAVAYCHFSATRGRNQDA
jgi:crossover junction endodeoxyribonuclease RuvC